MGLFFIRLYPHWERQVYQTRQINKGTCEVRCRVDSRIHQAKLQTSLYSRRPYLTSQTQKFSTIQGKSYEDRPLSLWCKRLSKQKPLIRSLLSD